MILNILTELKNKLTELEEIRDKLNQMVVSNEYSKNEILLVSQELDKIIVYLYNFQK